MLLIQKKSPLNTFTYLEKSDFLRCIVNVILPPSELKSRSEILILHTLTLKTPYFNANRWNSDLEIWILKFLHIFSFILFI